MGVQSVRQARWPTYAMAVLSPGYAADEAVFAAQGEPGFPGGPVVPAEEYERYAGDMMDVAKAQWLVSATGLLGPCSVMATVTSVGRRVPPVLMLLALAGALAVGAGAGAMIVHGFVGLGVGWRWYHGVLGIVVLALLMATIWSYAQETKHVAL